MFPRVSPRPPGAPQSNPPPPPINYPISVSPLPVPQAPMASSAAASQPDMDEARCFACSLSLSARNHAAPSM
eukprot:2301250-Pyramimonas_sp.AAC.1